MILVLKEHELVILVRPRVIVGLRAGDILRVLLVLLHLNIEVAILVVERLDMLEQLVFASLVGALKDVALSLKGAASARAQVSVPSFPSESLVQDLGIVVRVGHAVEVGGVALAREAILLVLLVLGDLVLDGVFVLLALLGNPRQEAPQRFILLEVVTVQLVDEVEVLRFVIPVLLPLGTLLEMSRSVLLLVAKVVVDQIDVVELKLDLAGLAAHRVEFGLHEVLVDLALLLVGRGLGRLGRQSIGAREPSPVHLTGLREDILGPPLVRLPSLVHRTDVKAVRYLD